MANLLHALVLASFAAAVPMLESRQSKCGPIGESTLSVQGFTFESRETFSTPAHQIASAEVSFNITNPQVDYTISCSATSSQLDDYFYGNQEYDCDAPNNLDAASFTYDRPSGTLAISASWYCPGGSDHLAAEGLKAFQPSCTTKKYENPDWKEGETYSQTTTNCLHINGDVSVTVGHLSS